MVVTYSLELASEAKREGGKVMGEYKQHHEESK